MTRRRLLALMSLVTLSSLAVPRLSAEEVASPAPRCFELRTYFAAEGKLGALNARFRDHTTRLFVRHGMTNVGYWMPVENPQRKLIYLLSYPDLVAREASWKAFQADPDWIAAKGESEKSGKLVEKVENRFLGLTDFSPVMKAPEAAAPHTFEMRTYTATPGNLPRLLDRFKNHTVELFTEHGMGHYGYFTPLPGQPGADDTLIYFLVHASPAAQAASFAAFRSDPRWTKVLADSEAAAGGSLTTAGGVKSELLIATDYSPVR